MPFLVRYSLRWVCGYIICPLRTTTDRDQAPCCLCQALAEEPGIRTQEARQEPTGLPLQTLQWVGQSICNVPSGFTLHPEVDALLKSRRCFSLSSTASRKTIPI